MLLRSAQALIDDVAGGASLVPRVLRAFERMPGADREPILNMIEREVEFRRLSEQTDDVLRGPRYVPNPGARIYLRAWDGKPATVWRADEIATALVRANQTLNAALRATPDTRVELQQAILDAFLSLAPDERAAAEFCVETVIMARQRILEGTARANPEPRTEPASGVEPEPPSLTADSTRRSS